MYTIYRISYSIGDIIKTRVSWYFSMLVQLTQVGNQCLIAMTQSSIISTNKCLKNYLNSLACENPPISNQDKLRTTDNRREFPYWFIDTLQRWADLSFKTLRLTQAALLFLNEKCRKWAMDDGTLGWPWENSATDTFWTGDETKIEADRLSCPLPWQMWEAGAQQWGARLLKAIPRFLSGCEYRSL